MRQAREFSKVYHDARDDRRFREVWHDDAALALWIRLLVQANESWPSPAPIPRSAKARPLGVLVRVGLVRMVGEDEYRIHGLDPEREYRRSRAIHANAVRWGRNGQSPGDSGEESSEESSEES